jgi:predicted Zn finger-like uncharacterized protein
MHIVCPNCAASYQVGATAFGPAGRQVRCVRCRAVWHQEQPSEVPPLAVVPRPVAAHEPAGDATVAAFKSELGPPSAAPATAAPEPVPTPEAESAPTVSENGDPAGPSLDQLIETPAAGEAPATETQAEPEQAAAPSLSDIAIPSEQTPKAPDAATDAPAKAASVENVAARRKITRGTARRRIPVRATRMPAIILLLACVVAALIGWRGTIVKHAPQMASLYAAIGMPVNLRGLIFSEVRVSRDIHDGVAVLMVEGTIASAASKPVEVPRLLFAMRNEAGGEVYAWTAMPTREVLEPGETLPFRSRLASPPGDGRDVTVRFFSRLDAIAGLR